MNQPSAFSPSLNRRALAVAGVVSAGAVAATLWAGTLPNAYLLNVHRIPPPYPYPWAGVLAYSVAILFEAAVFVGIACVLAGPLRDLLAAALAGPAAVLFALGTMHQPSYIVPHLAWLLLCFLFFSVMLAFTGLRALAQRPRRRSAPLVSE